MLRSHLTGLGMANNVGTPNTKLDVAAGQCADDTGALMMTLAAATIDCGVTGANGLDTGALASSTWYHVFAIGKATDGTTAFLASTSLASPTLPGGYTLKRRIGSFKTDGSSHILSFHQYGDEFWFDTPRLDVNAAAMSTGSRTARTLSVPPNTTAIFNFRSVFLNPASDNFVIFTTGDQPDLAPSSTQFSLTDTTVSSGFGTPVLNGTGIRVRANASSQIYDRDVQGANATYLTLGYIDRRGRDD
jgi:hypothetical protein